MYCASWTSNFPGDASNLAPISSTFTPSACVYCTFLTVLHRMFCSEPCHTIVNWYPVFNRQSRKLLSESMIFLVGIVFSTCSREKNDDLEDSMQQCKLHIDIHNHSKKQCENEDRYRISMTWWELIINCWQYNAPVLWQQFCFTDQQILQLH